jgi:hypothetical protein
MRETQNPFFVGFPGVERNEDFVEGNVVGPQRQPWPHRPRGVVLVADHELQSHLESLVGLPAQSVHLKSLVRESQEEPEKSRGVKLKSSTFHSP